uniref:Uncharacterized protein n=1 Tax=Strigamia maritima TaxID=126957 RepID=T1JBJ3_STRMM
MSIASKAKKCTDNVELEQFREVIPRVKCCFNVVKTLTHLIDLKKIESGVYKKFNFGEKNILHPFLNSI